MELSDHCHLTYCTNIHPGESWPAVFASLGQYVPPLKARLSPQAPFGIGLRLSDQASRQLEQDNALDEFRHWLEDHHCYVFTLNGFPFGGFHDQTVKDQVHQPDWTTAERLGYTLRLSRQLAALLPPGMDGGISTSPLSYRYWYPTESAREAATLRAAQQMLELADRLFLLERQSGRYIHLDIEPEPDGLLATTRDTVDFFDRWLLPMGVTHFAGRLSPTDAESVIRRHLKVCYDVCHFAVEYEDHREALRRFQEAGIGIGKVQISAALRAELPADTAERDQLRRQFEAFDESTYLHQVVARDHQGRLTHYPDLGPALAHFHDPQVCEWRTHFHVPIFIDRYRRLLSTREDIQTVLALQRREPFTRHLEVETYTWEVLPEDLRTDLISSIERELRWVMMEYGG